MSDEVDYETTGAASGERYHIKGETSSASDLLTAEEFERRVENYTAASHDDAEVIGLELIAHDRALRAERECYKEALEVMASGAWPYGMSDVAFARAALAGPDTGEGS